MDKIIRTPTEAKGGITSIEKERMAELVKKWTKIAFRTEPIEKGKITSAIHSLYKAANLEKPAVVIVPSPFVMALAYGLSTAWWHLKIKGNQRSGLATRAATDAATSAVTDDATRDATRDATDEATIDATRDATDAATRAATFAATDAATRDATDEATIDATRDATDAATRAATDAATFAATRAATFAATDAATRDATRDATDDATRDATDDATRDTTEAATIDATYDATRDATFDATRAATDAATDAATKVPYISWLKQLATQFLGSDFELGFSCIKQWTRVYQGGNMWAGWQSYAEAMEEIIGLTGLDCWEKHRSYRDCALHGGFRVMHEKFCIVSDFPEKLEIDDQNRPHCEHGPSHRWRDGFEIYHLHGVRFPKELYLKIVSREMDMKDILKIADIDQRVQAMKFAKTGLREFYQAEGGKRIDHFVKMDKEGRPINYELWKVPAGKTFSSTVHFAVYDCPSARERGESREYAKGVPEFKTAAEALAWGMSSDETVLTGEDWKKLVPLIHES